MAIKMVPDLGAPLLVTAVDLGFESAKPEWSEWVEYIMAAGGYVAAFMGWGGDFAKNVGMSAAPLALKKIYNRVKGGTTSSLSLRRVSRYPAPASQSPFEGVKLV